MIFLQSKKSNKKTSQFSLAILTELTIKLVENKGENFYPKASIYWR